MLSCKKNLYVFYVLVLYLNVERHDDDEWSIEFYDHIQAARYD